MDANRFKKVSNATAVFWRKLLVAEKRFRRLHETEFLREVPFSARYLNGAWVNSITKDQ